MNTWGFDFRTRHREISNIFFFSFEISTKIRDDSVTRVELTLALDVYSNA